MGNMKDNRTRALKRRHRDLCSRNLSISGLFDTRTGAATHLGAPTWETALNGFLVDAETGTWTRFSLPEPEFRSPTSPGGIEPAAPRANGQWRSVPPLVLSRQGLFVTFVACHGVFEALLFFWWILT